MKGWILINFFPPKLEWSLTSIMDTERMRTTIKISICGFINTVHYWRTAAFYIRAVQIPTTNGLRYT
jgi:hypothetical protein